eukprot:gene13871-4820_t
MAAKKKRLLMADNKWGFRYILSIKCCFSKFCWLFPLQHKTAVSVYKVAKFLFDVEGPPKVVQSDNGKEFVNHLITKLSKDYGFALVRGRPYTPRHQGQIENLNKTVKSYLRKLLQNFQQDEQGKVWPLLLPGIADKINKSYHSTIDDIPFRIYRNRDVDSIRYTIVPDDISISSQMSPAMDFETLDSGNEEVSSSDDCYNEDYNYDDDEKYISKKMENLSLMIPSPLRMYSNLL